MEGRDPNSICVGPFSDGYLSCVNVLCPSGSTFLIFSGVTFILVSPPHFALETVFFHRPVFLRKNFLLPLGYGVSTPSPNFGLFDRVPTAPKGPFLTNKGLGPSIRISFFPATPWDPRFFSPRGPRFFSYVKNSPAFPPCHEPRALISFSE